MARRPDKKSIEQVLAENFKALREVKRPAKLGVSPKTANNVERARHNTKLSTVSALADNLGVEPYQLLIPVEDQKFLAVILAWAQSDARGKDDLHAIAETILKRRGEPADAKPANAATVHRRRDGAG